MITLSSGRFNFNLPSSSKWFSKSLIVRGAGFEDDSITGTKATVVNSSIEIGNGGIPGYDDDGNPVNNGKVDGCKFEGISFNGNNIYITGLETCDITFAKCKFTNLDIQTSNSSIKDFTIRQCVFSNLYSNMYGYAEAQNLYITNSHFNRIGVIKSNSTIYVDHCVATYTNR